MSVLYPFSASSQLGQRRCHNVIITSWLTLSQRCGTVKNESCSNVGLQRCDNIVVWCSQDVATTLLQRRHNIKHLVSRPFHYGQFGFLSRHRNVRELQKYLNIEFSLWQARRTLVNSWICLLLVCEQDKVARLGAKVFSATSLICPLTFQLFQTDEVFTVNGRETHTHKGIKWQ